jgi:hypothetical protein
MNTLSQRRGVFFNDSSSAGIQQSVDRRIEAVAHMEIQFGGEAKRELQQLPQ